MFDLVIRFVFVIILLVVYVVFVYKWEDIKQWIADKFID